MENPHLDHITPIDNENNWKKEVDGCRVRTLNQIGNIKETFSLGLKSIEESFINSFDIYFNKLFPKLKEYETLIDKNIESEELKKNCYKEMNSFLNQILKDKVINYQNYKDEVTKLTKQLIEILIKDNYTKLDEFINVKINEQIKEREDEEIRNYKKNKNKKKIEINPENIKTFCKDSNLDYEKLVLKNITKEDLESLFFGSRANSVFSISGEPAPNPEFKYKNITDISIKDSQNLENINLVSYFPDIDNLKIINCKLSYKIHEKINFQKLESLKLEGIGLINENFNPLFEQIRKNEIMRKNLRIFSVKNNNITFLDYKKGYADNILKAMAFNNLEILDMSYNKLYLFQNQIFNSLDKISLIDLTDNNIAFPTNLTELLKAAKSKKCLVLMTNNLAILKEKANVEYNQYLTQIFHETHYPLNNITLANIFCKNNYKDIFKLEIIKFKVSLEYLNLSNGELRDDDLIKLLNENWVFPNLKYFILDSNHLTDNFLYSLIKKEYNFDKKLYNLKVFNLSNNQINCNDVDKFKEFLTLFKNLEILELKFTPIEQYITQFLKKKVIEYHNSQKNQKQSSANLDVNETKISQIIENNYLKDKTKITIKIIDYISSKYMKILISHLPHLLERIILENNLQQ